MKIESLHDIKSAIRITGNESGPSVVVFGGTHGNEVSGIHAIEKVLFDFYTGTRELISGTVTIVRVNEEAIQAKKRFIEYNVNRLYKDTYESDIDSSSYEYRRVQSLKSLLEECDYFFDLHSASIAQEPFLICEEGPATFFSQLGISKIVTGWNSFSDGVIGGDAENYANNHGAIAATLEAGSHFDPTSIDVAYHAVLTMLSTLNMISLKRDYKLNGGSSEVFEMYHVVIKESEDFRYLVEPKNFLFIPNNTAYAYQGGTELRVTEDSYFIIPVMPENKKLGTEICYLGRKAA